MTVAVHVIDVSSVFPAYLPLPGSHALLFAAGQDGLGSAASAGARCNEDCRCR
jgi:hypothetical protein